MTANGEESGPNREVELKLALAPADVERLLSHPALRAAAAAPPRAQRLSSTYWDTPERALIAEGMVLRIRRAGGRRLQTVKSWDGAAGRLVRREWECPAADDSPDPRLIGDAEIRRLVEMRAAQGLQPMFRSDIRRRAWLVGLGANRIECALDQGAIVAGAARLPVCEVELELKRGSAAALFALARRLNRTVPLRLSPETKAERGYRLLTDAPPAPHKARPVRLKASMSVREATVEILRNCLVQVVGNLDAAADGRDPEGVHQLRVGLRRLRAALSLFEDVVAVPGRWLDDLRRIQRAVAPARDWDVLIAGTLAASAPHLGDQEGLARLREAAEAERAKAYAQCRAVLADRRTTETLLRLEAWVESGLPVGGRGRPAAPEGDEAVLDGDIHRYAARALRQRRERVRKLAAKLNTLDNRRLHRLRIRVKKLRYALEFFRDLRRGRVARRALDRLREFADGLGLVNDGVVVLATVSRLETLAGPGSERAAAQVEGWCAAQIAQTRAGLGRQWQAFAAADGR